VFPVAKDKGLILTSEQVNFNQQEVNINLKKVNFNLPGLILTQPENQEYQGFTENQVNINPKQQDSSILLYNNINNNTCINKEKEKEKKIKKEKKKKGGGRIGRLSYTPAFERFWEKYPRKEGKNRAFLEWEKAILREDIDVIMDGLERYIDYITAAKIEPRYIMLACNWLKQDRWQDAYIIKNNRFEKLGKYVDYLDK